jgi:hypothetical protein
MTLPVMTGWRARFEQLGNSEDNARRWGVSIFDKIATGEEAFTYTDGSGDADGGGEELDGYHVQSVWDGQKIDADDTCPDATGLMIEEFAYVDVDGVVGAAPALEFAGWGVEASAAESAVDAPLTTATLTLELDGDGGADTEHLSLSYAWQRHTVDFRRYDPLGSYWWPQTEFADSEYVGGRVRTVKYCRAPYPIHLQGVYSNSAGIEHVTVKNVGLTITGGGVGVLQYHYENPAPPPPLTPPPPPPPPPPPEPPTPSTSP